METDKQAGPTRPPHPHHPHHPPRPTLPTHPHPRESQHPMIPCKNSTPSEADYFCHLDIQALYWLPNFQPETQEIKQKSNQGASLNMSSCMGAWGFVFVLMFGGRGLFILRVNTRHTTNHSFAMIQPTSQQPKPAGFLTREVFTEQK